MNEISDEQLRIQIAEWYGFRVVQTEDKEFPFQLFYRDVPQGPKWTKREGALSHGLPNYPNDLNAMRDAEEKLTGRQCLEYVKRLNETTNYLAHVTAFSMIHATARQRALALVRTIKQEGK